MSFDVAWKRNLIYIDRLKIAGPDVTKEYLAKSGKIPRGFSKVRLTRDDDGPVFVADK